MAVVLACGGWLHLVDVLYILNALDVGGCNIERVYRVPYICPRSCLLLCVYEIGSRWVVICL